MLSIQHYHSPVVRQVEGGRRKLLSCSVWQSATSSALETTHVSQCMRAAPVHFAASKESEQAFVPNLFFILFFLARHTSPWSSRMISGRAVEQGAVPTCWKLPRAFLSSPKTQKTFLRILTLIKNHSPPISPIIPPIIHPTPRGSNGASACS